jgi:hypothetical protein
MESKRLSMRGEKRLCRWSRKSFSMSFLPQPFTRLLITHSELSLPPLSSLSLRQQQEAQPPVPRTYNAPPAPSQASPYQRSLDENSRIPAPIPQRASIVPMASPPITATWNPNMGITFGGAPPPNQQQEQNNGGQKSPPSWPPPGAQTWDPNRGFKFA